MAGLPNVKKFYFNQKTPSPNSLIANLTDLGGQVSAVPSPTRPSPLWSYTLHRVCSGRELGSGREGSTPGGTPAILSCHPKALLSASVPGSTRAAEGPKGNSTQVAGWPPRPACKGSKVTCPGMAHPVQSPNPEHK